MTKRSGIRHISYTVKYSKAVTLYFEIGESSVSKLHILEGRGNKSFIFILRAGVGKHFQ